MVCKKGYNWDIRGIKTYQNVSRYLWLPSERASCPRTSLPLWVGWFKGFHRQGGSDPTSLAYVDYKKSGAPKSDRWSSWSSWSSFPQILTWTGCNYVLISQFQPKNSSCFFSTGCNCVICNCVFVVNKQIFFLDGSNQNSSSPPHWCAPLSTWTLDPSPTCPAIVPDGVLERGHPDGICPVDIAAIN